MKKLFVLLTLMAFIFTGIAQTKKDSKGFLPEEFKNLYFGMSIEDFVEARELGMVEFDKTFEFRITYAETIDDGDILGAGYYFDAEGNIPFYEIIIEYYDAEERDMAAADLLGSPNAGDEWYFERKRKFDIKAWIYQNKLIIVALLPGTEWVESE